MRPSPGVEKPISAAWLYLIRSATVSRFSMRPDATGFFEADTGNPAKTISTASARHLVMGLRASGCLFRHREVIDAARRRGRVAFGDEGAVAEPGFPPRQSGHTRQLAGNRRAG